MPVVNRHENTAPLLANRGSPSTLFVCPTSGRSSVQHCWSQPVTSDISSAGHLAETTGLVPVPKRFG